MILANLKIVLIMLQQGAIDGSWFDVTIEDGRFIEMDEPAGEKDNRE